jgi:hypothetical protein
MSSFKRKVKKESDDKQQSSISQVTANDGNQFESSSISAVMDISGTRPWIHNGQCIVSSGHRQLDDLIGGGIPVGTVSMYSYDEVSSYCQTLLSYNIAESLSHDHHTFLILRDSNEADMLLKAVPHNSKIGKQGSNEDVEDSKENNKAQKDASQVTGGGDWGLKIAWQYSKYLSKYNFHFLLFSYLLTRYRKGNSQENWKN